MLNLNAKQSKALKVAAAIMTARAFIALCCNVWNADAARYKALEQKHADEMAQCWRDYADNKNGGGCHYEGIYIDHGQTLLDLEVIAKPLAN